MTTLKSGMKWCCHVWNTPSQWVGGASKGMQQKTLSQKVHRSNNPMDIKTATTKGWEAAVYITHD